MSIEIPKKQIILAEDALRSLEKDLTDAKRRLENE